MKISVLHQKIIVGCIVVLLLLILILGRIYGAFVPLELPVRDIAAYTLGSYSKPTGVPGVTIIMNDSGASHSGEYAFWVCSESLWRGKTILYQGVVDDPKSPIFLMRINGSTINLVYEDSVWGEQDINLYN